MAYEQAGYEPSIYNAGRLREPTAFQADSIGREAAPRPLAGSGILITLFGLGLERHHGPDALLIADPCLRPGSFEFGAPCADQF
jgi:hypothetical protein